MDGNGPNGCPRCSVLTQPLAVSYIPPWRSFLGIWFCVCCPWDYFAERSPVIYTNSHNLAFFIISTFAWTNNGTSTTSRFFLNCHFWVPKGSPVHHFFPRPSVFRPWALSEMKTGWRDRRRCRGIDAVDGLGWCREKIYSWLEKIYPLCISYPLASRNIYYIQGIWIQKYSDLISRPTIDDEESSQYGLRLDTLIYLDSW